MKTIEVTKTKLDKKDFVRRTALDGDCTRFINEDVLVTHDGKPIILYVKLKEDTNALRWATQQVKFANDTRTNGLKTHSRTFGFMPRRTLLADYCHDSLLESIGAKPHAILKNFSQEVEHYYEKYFPETLEKHLKIVEEKILPEWRMSDSPFTSGNINKDNQINYHLDAGNFKGCLSNMIAFKRGVKGGHLACPEYDLLFEIADDTLLIFNGQDIIHGVTPIEKTQEDGYRYTVVYYSLSQMWKCEPIKEEVKRIRKVKRQRELKRKRQ